MDPDLCETARVTVGLPPATEPPPSPAADLDLTVPLEVAEVGTSYEFPVAIGQVLNMRADLVDGTCTRLGGSYAGPGSTVQMSMRERLGRAEDSHHDTRPSAGLTPPANWSCSSLVCVVHEVPWGGWK